MASKDEHNVRCEMGTELAMATGEFVAAYEKLLSLWPRDRGSQALGIRIDVERYAKVRRMRDGRIIGPSDSLELDDECYFHVRFKKVDLIYEQYLAENSDGLTP